MNIRILATLLSLLSTSALAAVHDDKVVFTHNNTMYGELKRLDRGRLYFDTVATDQIPIDWQHVVAVVSNQQLQVEHANGERYLGSLVNTEPGYLSVKADNGVQQLPLIDVVRITPIEKRILDRFDVDLSAGYSFTKASDVQATNFGLSVEYVTERYRRSIEAELATTSDSESDQTTRWNIDLSNRRLRANRWFTGYIGSLEQNDGLGLDLRTSLGAGVGRYQWQSNERSLALLAGLLVSREEVAGDADSETTIEGILSAEFELFRYDEPEIDLSTGLDIIPNLSDTGRVRVELDIALRWEMFNDVFWELKFYNSFDNRPPSEEGSKNDYGVNTGIVWNL